jgi:hypothetical protein
MDYVFQYSLILCPQVSNTFQVIQGHAKYITYIGWVLKINNAYGKKRNVATNFIDIENTYNQR